MILYRYVLLLAIISPLHSFSQYIWSDSTVGYGIKPEVVIHQETAYIAYLSETNPGFVKCAEIKPSHFSNETVTTGYFYGPLDIGINSQGVPAIVYHDHDTEDLGYATKTGDSWSIERIENDGHDGWDGSIYFDRNDNAHIISIDPGAGVELARQVSDEWRVDNVDPAQTNYKFATSIVGDGDHIYLAYHITSTNSLHFAHNINNEWESELIADDAIFPSMILNQQGEPIIAYYKRGNPGHISIAQRVNGVWNSTKIEDIEDIVVNFSGARKIVDLAMDSNGLIHIAISNKKIVRHGILENGNWSIHTAYSHPGETDLGQQVSLAIDQNDMPVISFYERNRDLEGGGAIHMLKALEKDSTTEEIDPEINFQILDRDSQSVGFFLIEMKGSNGANLGNINSNQNINLSQLPLGVRDLCPLKLDNAEEDLSALDLVRMRNIVLTSEHSCKEDIIAADVNKSGSISGLDIIQSLNIIIGKTSTFPEQDSWRFYREGIDISGQSLTEIYNHGCVSIDEIMDDQSIQFKGIKLGDIKCAE